MSVFGLADDSKMDAGLGAIEAPSTSFTDVFSAAVPSTARNYLSNSKQFFSDEEERGRDKSYKQLTGRNLIDDVLASKPDDLKLQASKFKGPGDRERMQAATDEYLNSLRANEPDKYGKISNSVEIGEVVRRKAKEALATQEKASAGATGKAALTGELAGGVVASLIDPVNLATIPLGAGLAHGILKTAAIEAGINIVAEVGTQPSVLSWQQELGNEYGVGDALTQIGTAGLFGAGIGAGAKALPIGFHKSKALFMSNLGKRMESLENMPAVRAAAHEERRFHIEEANPSRYSDSIDSAVHREALAEIDAAINEGRALNPEKIRISDEQMRALKAADMDEGAAQLHQRLAQTDETMALKKQASGLAEDGPFVDYGRPAEPSMERQLEIEQLKESPEWKSKEKSNFDERFKSEDGDEWIYGEHKDVGMSVDDIRRQFKDDHEFYSAISSCGLGGG